MFEQSVISHPGNKRWSIAVSLSGQLLFLTAAVLVQMVFTDQLSIVRWTKTYVAPAVLPPAVPLIEAHSSARTNQVHAPAASKVFAAPSRIPDRVAMVTDAATLLPEAGPGVPFSTGALPTVPGLIGDLVRPAAAAPPKAAVPPAPAKPHPVSSGVQSAKLLRKVMPVYPQLAKQARISGTVRLVGIIGKDGTIQNLQLVSGAPLLVNAALDAVRQWIYRPTLLNGEPVEVIAPIDVIFTLTQ